MKKYLIAIFSIITLSISAEAQNVGIGTNTPLEKLSVGSTSQFRVDASGNITRINNLQYSFPSLAGSANQVLKNDGSGNLTWTSLPLQNKPVIRVFDIVNDPFFSNWDIDDAADYNGAPFNLDPTIVLYRGLTYQFNINAPGHPFRIADSHLGPTYNVGVSANDVSVGTIIFTVPMDAPATLHYYCIIHTVMNGQIIIR